MQKLVVIDPGHSGAIEPGAVYDGCTEAYLTLSISRLLAANLSALGCRVALTRNGEIDTDDLAFRADIANRLGADLFVSIHINSFGSIHANGCESWHYPGSAYGRQLCECIQAAMGVLPFQNRGVKSARFQVLRDTSCPAALVECGFISNDRDRTFLQSGEGQAAIAAAIATGIINHLDRQTGAAV